MQKEINIWLNYNPHKNKRLAKPYSDAILQQLLQNTLNTSARIAIKKSKNGKPYVDEPIFFSHSNCRQLHAYVITTAHDIGIDVEYINKKRAVMKLASRYFHPKESKIITDLPTAEKSSMFFKQWTHKEAWCKLDGGNLWSYLNKLPGDEKGLFLYESDRIDGYALAIASPQKIDKIRINSIGNQ